MEQELMDILTDLRPDVDFETETALIDDHILEPENFNSAKSLLAMVQRLQDED